MNVRFESCADDYLKTLEDAVTESLKAAGQEAVAAIQQQMLTGYEHPIVNTGALLGSIRCSVDEATLHVGTSLPYAHAVHDGTSRMPGRPFLTDGIRSANLFGILTRTLADHFL